MTKNRNIFQPISKDKESDNEVNELFENLEPFFQSVLVKFDKILLPQKAHYQSFFTQCVNTAGSNFYDSCVTRFGKRISEGFRTSIETMKSIPINEEFPKRIKEDLDKWKYAKDCFLLLFRQFSYAMAAGATMTIEMIVKDKWNSEYLQTLNSQLSLCEALNKIFSDNRASAYYNDVIPIKHILALYKKECITTALKAEQALFNEFKEKFIETAKIDYKKFLHQYLSEGVHRFLTQAKNFFDAENQRIVNAVDEEIGEKMKEHLENIFVRPSIDRVLKEMDKVLEKDDKVEFQAITMLYDKLMVTNVNVPVLNSFAEKVRIHFCKSIQDKIEDHVKGNIDFSKDPEKVVKLLFTFLDRLNDMEKKIF